jgi:hypothetical protein
VGDGMKAVKLHAEYEDFPSVTDSVNEKVFPNAVVDLERFGALSNV